MERSGTTSRLTAALEARPALLAVYATTTGFCTYFCMYAFRKPFAAAKFEKLRERGLLFPF